MVKKTVLLLIIIVCVAFLIWLAKNKGGPDTAPADKQDLHSDAASTASVGEQDLLFDTGTDGFPDSLAGTWKADSSQWQITFDPNGTIISIINEPGMNMEYAAGGFVQQGLENKHLLFSFGSWTTEFNPSNRWLTAVIEMDTVRMQFADRHFDGDMKYILAGEISNDAKGWNAKVETFMTLEELGVGDPDAAKTEYLLFKKVTND